MNEINDLIDISNIKVLHQIAKQAGFEDEVPTIDQFIDDPYYLGKVLGQGLYPIWREAAREVFPTPYHSPYDELILSGAIGLGKSTFGLLVQMYDMCRMLSLANPHQYYNLIESTKISFPLLNATQKLAFGVLWDQFQTWVENSPYFKSKLNHKDKKTMFIKNIDVVVGSRGGEFLGQATAGAIFSEINDMTVIGGQAEDNLDTISTRRDSRFKGKNKEVFGHIILDSSSKGNRSFIDVRLEEKRKKGINDFKVFAYTHWAAKWHLGGYSGKYFKVYAGDEHIDPFILDDGVDRSDLLDRLDQSRMIDVPVEHRQSFEFNIIKSLRDLAGMATFSSSAFISSNEIIQDTFIRPNPVSKNMIVLDFFDENQQLISYLDVTSLKSLNNAPRFIHIDLGLKNDSTGIACSYIDRYEEFEVYDPVKGGKVVLVEPLYVTEWVMEIRAVPGQEVPIFKIKKFILDMKGLGYPIVCVSTDGFQSTNLRQDLLAAGLNTQLISVDRTKDPYNNLRNTILERRLSCIHSNKLIKEIRELEENDQKFDHPPEGSKDISDAVCGSIWSAKENAQMASKINNVTANTLSTALGVINSSKNKLAREMFRGFK